MAFGGPLKGNPFLNIGNNSIVKSITGGLGSLGSVIDEFVIFLVISAVFGLIILFFYSRSTDEMSKQIAKLYFILLGNFAIFAVGVDAIFTATGIRSCDIKSAKSIGSVLQFFNLL